MNPYLLVIIAVCLISPFVLSIAANQNNKYKAQLKNIILLFLVLQLVLGMFNWENFNQEGRSGYQLALGFPDSLLGLFFAVSLLQLSLLTFNRYQLSLYATILNFLNTFLIFISMIRLGNLLGFQAVSFASIATVFLVLIGNVIALAFINRDKNILKKYLR